MVDAMAVLGAAAAAKLAGDRMVRDFVAYIRETSVNVSTTAQSYTSSSRRTHPRRNRKARLSRPMKPSTSALGRRPPSSRPSKKVSTMSDAELEAELDARRRRRARERELYTRAMRSDKLAALESELDSLRHEIGRLDHPADIRPAGTPPTSRWEPLPRSRRPPLSSATTVAAHVPVPAGTLRHAAPLTQPPQIPRAAGGPPPPPPPPPRSSPGGADDDDDDLDVDPERQKREKLERQKRREAKKKEREQTQKKLTLADIIRAAGPDPVRRLKPASMKPADAEQEEWERAKRDREEREERQEKERLEKERLAKEGSKRATEKSADSDKGDREIVSNEEEGDKNNDVGEKPKTSGGEGDAKKNVKGKDVSKEKNHAKVSVPGSKKNGDDVNENQKAPAPTHRKGGKESNGEEKLGDAEQLSRSLMGSDTGKLVEKGGAVKKSNEAVQNAEDQKQAEVPTETANEKKGNSKASVDEGTENVAPNAKFNVSEKVAAVDGSDKSGASDSNLVSHKSS